MVKDALRPFVWGLVGMAVMLLAWHAWTDHVLVHNIVAAISRPAPQATMQDNSE